MTIVKYLLLGIEVIIGLLLIGVILLQRSKDQGVGLAFGAGMGESLFGAQAVNVLVKVTVVLAVLFFLNTLVLARLFSSMEERSSLMQGEIERPLQPQGAPATGGAQPGAPAGPGTIQPAAPLVPAPAADAGAGGGTAPVEVDSGTAAGGSSDTE